MAYPTVTIGGTNYDVYADQATADEYLAASIGASAWRDADNDTKAMGLVSATRALDRQAWIGEKTDPDQTLDWPRTGIDDVDPDTVPDLIVQACIELAAVFVADPEFMSTVTATVARRLKAGSVEIENFRQFGVVPRWPQLIRDLVGQWFAGQGDLAAGSEAYGTCGKSAFRRGYPFSRGF